MSASELRTFIEKSLEISNFEIQRYTPIRGKLAGEILEHKSGQVPQMYSRVHFSPHSVTHMDLPWCLDQAELEKAKAAGYRNTVPLDPLVMTELMKYYLRIRLLDTLVLDFSEKGKILTEFLDETGFIQRNLDSIAFEKMMDLLEIKQGRDILHVASPREIRNRFLIFRTGWDEQFNMFSTNLDNPYFELRYPYLVYPFLSLSTVRWLVEEMHVKGIGCETPGIDNPAYYTTPHFAPNYAKKYLYYRLQPTFRPVSILLLTNSCYYIKHLANLDILGKGDIYRRRITKGRTCMIPTWLGTRDVALAKMLFLRDE